MSLRGGPVEVIGQSADLVAHHLRLWGLSARAGSSEVAVLREEEGSGDHVDSAARRRFAILLQPGDDVLACLGMRRMPDSADRCVRFQDFDGHAWGTPPTLHAVHNYALPDPLNVVACSDTGASWAWARHGNRDLLVVGTALGADLLRFRQGDPARVTSRRGAEYWGIPGERPNYLFEQQIPAGAEFERPTDWWAMACASSIAGRCGETLRPLLPGGAPGAVVITGDDDQAYLDKYDEQLRLLEGLPITYFLHPLTRHTTDTLNRLQREHLVEYALHPDAWEQPNRYPELFREQVTWFQRLLGRSPRAVRNHGFLNDGYWGHLPVWLEAGVQTSSNLPGVNGTVLNGSLLPARVSWSGALSPHWSILTAIGDGVRFALGMTGPQSAACVTAAAERIVQSGVPGVLVLNLHPQNVAETTEMHQAARALVERLGFAAMTLDDCIEWFAARDRDLDDD